MTDDPVFQKTYQFKAAILLQQSSPEYNCKTHYLFYLVIRFTKLLASPKGTCDMKVSVSYFFIHNDYTAVMETLRMKHGTKNTKESNKDDKSYDTKDLS